MKRAIVVITCLVAFAIGSGWSSGSVAAEWLRYKDPRFGTSTLYPVDLFSEQTATPTGATFSGMGGFLEISAAHLSVNSVDELRRLMAETPGYDRVTYSPQGRNWLVVSGYRGENIFYEKYFVNDGVVEGFALDYPITSRKLFDPVVERIEDSFSPGR